MPRISVRVASITESATLAVDAKAKALRASGVDVIGFAAGEPDFPTPDHIVEAAVEAARDPRNHRYTPTAGLPELREAVAAKTSRDSGLNADASCVVVTNGGKQAVYEIFQTLLDPGDEVLVPSPYWTTYPEAIKLAGGVPVTVFAGSEAGYRVNVEQLESALTPRTKALLFVSPSNPTGTVYSSDETARIAEWADAHGLWVISDEIYQNLGYGDEPPAGIAHVGPVTLRDRLVLLNGVAKTYAMTGWRVGWMVAPLDVAHAVTRLQSHLTSNVADVSQRAAIAALTGPQEPAARMREAFARRRETIVSTLTAIPGIVLPEPAGAFYVYPDVREILRSTGSAGGPSTSVQLADMLLERAKVAVVPGEAFGPGGYLRLSYALADDQLAEGLRRITDFFASL